MQLFGYIALLTPFLLLIISERILITVFWKPYSVPRYLIGVAGGLLLLVSTTTLVHGVLLGSEPMGVILVNPALSNDPDPYRLWEESVPVCDSQSALVEELKADGWVETASQLTSMQLARCGWGGGIIGAVIYETGYRLLGGLLMFFLPIVGFGTGAVLWIGSIIDQLRWNSPQQSSLT
jgi:hypothetical protein